MLIKKEGSKIQISALLDWEFSFAGSYLIDAGQFLRYSHRLPAYYKTNFIAGFSSTGQQLPKDWEVQAKALDLLSLLTLVDSNSKDERPVLIKDVIGLIERTIYLY